MDALWAGYGAGPDVLQDVDFQLAVGEAAVVSGPTAAGKTTLLHLLRLALPPRAGDAVVLNESILRLPDSRRARLKRRIGYVSEEPTFVEEWSVFDNVALPLRVAKKKPSEYKADVDELLAFVGLEAAAQDPTSRLSFAERRRVAIARALAGKPDLILADEPGAGLGVDGAMRTLRLIAEMRRVGAGVVITTQSPELAEGLDVTHWHIEEGRLAGQSRGAPPPEAEDYFGDDDAGAESLS